MKDAPNHVPINMISLAHTAHETLEDGNVPIFLVVVITPDPLHLSLHHHCDRTGIPLSNLCVDVNTICI